MGTYARERAKDRIRITELAARGDDLVTCWRESTELLERTVPRRALRTAEDPDSPGEIAVSRVLARSGTGVVLHGAALFTDGTRRVASSPSQVIRRGSSRC